MRFLHKDDEERSWIKLQGPVVRKVDSAIRRIAIFSNFLKLFIYWYTCKPD